MCDPAWRPSIRPPGPVAPLRTIWQGYSLWSLTKNFMSARDNLAESLREFYIRSHRVMDRLMRSHGASLARTKLLLYISRLRQPRSTDIAEAFGFAPRTVTEAIDALEREGLVRREADPNDRRAKRIVMTADGQNAIDASEPVRRELIDRLYNALSEEEAEQLAALLGRLIDRLGEIEHQKYP
ncbi:MarR family winged helix-turn-helix transcriptional regulator [Sphingomonas oryzagri]